MADDKFDGAHQAADTSNGFASDNHRDKVTKPHAEKPQTVASTYDRNLAALGDADENAFADNLSGKTPAGDDRRSHTAQTQTQKS